jgi:excisionase family DNA binding protein
MKDRPDFANEESLLTADEVASVLRVKRVTVLAAASDGRIPSVKVWKGKKRALVRFRRDVIDRLLCDRAGS